MPGAEFPKSVRLLKHADFDQVYKNGRRQFSGHMTVFFRRREDAQGPRVGLTVGKALGGSVERNRIKRRMREAVRLHLGELSGPVDVVINPKKSVLKAEFGELSAEVAQAFQKIGRQSAVGSRQPEQA